MKVIGCMATYNKRERTRHRAIDSVKGQLDSLCIVDNSISKIDRADNAKFMALDTIEEPCYLFLLDDDIIYPPDYVERTIEAIKRHDCIITYHGRRLNGVGLNYYMHHKSFPCMGSVQQDEIIDVAGTGVTAFDTQYFHPKGLADSPDLHMSDLVFSLEAAKQRKQIGVLSHKAGWLKPINNRETIYERFHRRCTRQSEIADEIFKLNHDRED